MGGGFDELALPGKVDALSPGSVSFAELVLARRRRADAPEGSPAESAYHERLAAFTRAHGDITAAYWSEYEAAAVAITAGTGTRLDRLLGRARPPALHRVSDWLLREEPRAAELLYRCDALAIRAGESLASLQLRIALQRILSLVSAVLAMHEARAAATSLEPTERNDRRLDELEHHLLAVEEYVERVGRANAVRIYVVAASASAATVVLGTLVAEIAAGSTPFADRAAAAVAAGALGAATSVLQRVSLDRAVLPIDVGRMPLAVLGASRGYVGAILGAAVYFVLAAKWVTIGSSGSSSSRAVYTYALVAFVAGFAERWARETFGEFSSSIPAASARRALDATERLPQTVEESVRTALLGAPLAKWRGFVGVSVDAPTNEDGRPTLAPRNDVELEITFAPEERGRGVERLIDIRDGVDAATVTFKLRLESDTVAVPAEEYVAEVPSSGSKKLAVPLTTPTASGTHQIWLRVSQRNRVVQMVPLELAVGAG
ncbi:MAG: hypothetical protein M3540_13085 [Actinomycetota bacterium]|nr:hypothetical protein [Actinomycetota bacterium]